MNPARTLDKEAFTMVRRLTKRMVIGLCFALVAVLLTAAIGEASPPRQEGPVRTDCQECHETVVTHWQDSAHGQAAVDPIFQEAWKEKGSPPECLSCHTTNYDPATGTWESDGISCSVCHSPQTAPHPETAMPTDPSARLCGTCHIDTHDEWQVSAHGEGEMTCVRCHNPHTTDLKVGNMRDLCTTCHTDEGHFYGYTAHAQQGLSCTDCHLRVSDSPTGEGHGKRVHTFAVDLHTCNQCHGEGMHFPVQSQEASSTGTEFMWSDYAPTEELCENTASNVVEEPESTQAGPLNYLLTAAVGMGFGIAVTPWAEGWLRRNGRGSENG